MALKPVINRLYLVKITSRIAAKIAVKITVKVYSNNFQEVNADCALFNGIQ